MLNVFLLTLAPSNAGESAGKRNAFVIFPPQSEDEAKPTGHLFVEPISKMVRKTTTVGLHFRSGKMCRASRPSNENGVGTD